MSSPIVTDLPIVGYFNRQRFAQYDPSDSANWYMLSNETGKKKMAMYPTMGRRHISLLGQNRLIFPSQPRFLDKSVNYAYAVVGDRIFQIDSNLNQFEITSQTKLTTVSGDIFSCFLNVGNISGSGITLMCFTDGQNMYIYNENTMQFGVVTDPNLPKNPWAMATFGNRVVVSSYNTSTFGLSELNLNYSITFDTMLGDCFTIGSGMSSIAIFAQEEGIIRQMCVLQNTLYIFNDYTTGIWANIQSVIPIVGGGITTFPWSKNTTYSFDYGISSINANTLDVDFGMMVWLGQNRNGLIQPLMSTGGKPKPISSKSIDVLLQRTANAEELNPFITDRGDGFLYNYENTMFYRLVGGVYTGTELLDQISTSNSIEYNFETQTWHRCIEANGERNRIQTHIFYASRHLVTVYNDATVYEMSGEFYNNEITNPAESNPQATDSYLQLPFRYERVTPNIVAGTIANLKSPGFYAEFKTNYVEIDFVFGEKSSLYSTTPFPNTNFIIAENSGADGNPVFIVAENDVNTFIIGEQGNYPVLTDNTYNTWYKPSIELLFSNDGGISFQTAGNLEFSQLGVYQWRMRWYQLGCSRNRVYKLVCVSPSPIVVLGGSMEVENVSGGAA